MLVNPEIMWAAAMQMIKKAREKSEVDTQKLKKKVRPMYHRIVLPPDTLLTLPELSPNTIAT